MLSWNDRDLEVHKLRQKELLLEAAQMRLAKEAGGRKRGKLVAIYGPALARTGRLLMLWGMRLQERYGELGEALDRAGHIRVEELIEPQTK